MSGRIFSPVSPKQVPNVFLPGRTEAHGTKRAFTQLTQSSTMEASSRHLWQRSTCTCAENKCAAVECAMCGAVVRAKCWALPVLSSDAVALKPVNDHLLGKGNMRDRHFANLHTTINCKLVWTVEGESGRMRGWGRTCRGGVVSLVRSSN